MRKDKESAMEMRKAGKSYQEIHTTLNISKGTLSAWLSGEEWSKSIKKRLSNLAREERTTRLKNLNSVRGENLAKAYETAREEARQEFESLKYDPLFISGIMLYWGEGSKNPKQGVKFANSDQKMIMFYVQFLLKSCRIPIEKVQAYVLIYPEIDEKTSRAYWSKMTGLPWENFTEGVVIKGRHAAHRLGWGVCAISVSSTYFKAKILEWIKLLPEELLRQGYYENI